MSKTFCPLPWINISVDTDGSVKPCCISTDYIKNDDGKKFNLGTDKISDFYNSPDYVSIRQKMLSGQEVAGCSQCYEQEKSNGFSQRMLYNSIWPLRLNHKEKVDNIKIKYLDLRFGNLCNLKCRSCHPLASSQLQKEINLIGSNQFLPLMSEDLNSWYTSDICNNNIEEHLDSLELLYLAGGEPSVNEKAINLLEKLVRENRSKKIAIKISTNLTNTNVEFYELLTNFKSVTLFVSLDGIGVIQEYLRYPSKWNQLDNNIRNLLKYKFNIICTPVIQITNLNCITELFDYCYNIKLSVDPIILESPEYLNLKYLPLDFKIDSWNKIDNWMKDKKIINKVFTQKLISLKTKCHENWDNMGIEKLKQFVQYNSMFDTHRKMFLKDINPDLYSIL